MLLVGSDSRVLRDWVMGKKLGQNLMVMRKADVGEKNFQVDVGLQEALK